jgi:Tfp pilus assembly protein PilO
LADPTSGVTTNLPTAADQLSAALSAPIPFFFAVGAVAVVIAGAVWKAFDGRYGGIIELTRTMLELARTEAQSAKAKESDLKQTVESLKRQLEKLADKSKNDRELQPLVQDLTIATTTASAQLSQLGQANTAVSESLSRIPLIGFPGPARITIVGTERRPKATSGSE